MLMPTKRAKNHDLNTQLNGDEGRTGQAFLRLGDILAEIAGDLDQDESGSHRSADVRMRRGASAQTWAVTIKKEGPSCQAPAEDALTDGTEGDCPHKSG